MTARTTTVGGTIETRWQPLAPLSAPYTATLQLIDTTGALASWSLTGLNFAYKASTVGIHVSHHARAHHEEVVADHLDGFDRPQPRHRRRAQADRSFH